MSPRRRTGADAPEAPWWAEGLTFTCTACGDCCRGPEPGFVEVDGPMIERLAARLELTVEAFTRRYVRRLADRGLLSLIEKKNGDCIFWAEGEGCQVYEDRPTQCRTFPFWPELLASREAWDEHAPACPGMTRAAGGVGRRYGRAEIEAALGGHGETGPSDRARGAAGGRRLARAARRDDGGDRS